MTKDSDIVIQVAKAMFEQVHGYHPDLNWDNAYSTHKELYLRYARVAEPIFREHYVQVYRYLDEEVGDMTF